MNQLSALVLRQIRQLIHKIEGHLTRHLTGEGSLVCDGMTGGGVEAGPAFASKVVIVYIYNL